MITMENVEADHITKARCQYGKVNTEETHWSICADTERKQQDKHCKGEAVWRRQGGRKRVREGKKIWICRTWRCSTYIFTHRNSYAEALLQSFTHKRLHTHTNALTHIISFFTHTRFYTQTLLHTDAFTRSPFYTQTLSHWRSYAPTLLRLLRTNTFSSRHCCTQRRLNTQKHWHTCAHICYFTRRRFYTHMLWHNKACTKYLPVLQ